MQPVIIVLSFNRELFTGLGVGIENIVLLTTDLGSDGSPAPSGRADPVAQMRTVERSLKAGAALRMKSPAAAVLTEIASGWLSRCQFASNGYRSILDFMLPGETFLSPRYSGSTESIVAISDARLREVEYPSGPVQSPAHILLCQLALVASQSENARLAERLVSIGRRDAFERMAHFFLELASRSRAKEMGGGMVFACPLTQADIGDALGLSTVHVNRVLKEMRSRHLLSLRNGRVELFDRDELAERVGFDAQYLQTPPDLP